jgi:hypothetical protein
MARERLTIPTPLCSDLLIRAHADMNDHPARNIRSKAKANDFEGQSSDR